MSKSDRESMSRSERKKNKKKKKPPKKQGLWKKIFLGLLGFILLVVVAGAGLFVYYASSAPELTDKDLRGTYASEFVDMNGEVLYTLGGEVREFASASDYPEVMTDALMAIEDQRFESHFGIDPIGITRAAVGYVVNQEIVGGGSTITQQLIKNSVFSTLQEDQTLERKAQEAWLAIQLEQELSKEQIMTLYLNRIHMGGNVYGVATAAEEYYGKPVSELELHEAAMFAGMPRAPNYYNPYVNEEAAEQRRNTVLNEMVDFGSITQAEADAAKQFSVTEGLQEPTEDANAEVFDSFINTAIEEVKEKTNFNPSTAGLTIHTNYDPNAQQLLYDVANSDEYVQFPNDELQTAITLIDSTTGKITAMIGGRKHEGIALRNRTTENSRSVGSTIKPLTVYGPAVELLQYSTYHQVYDEPYELNGWPPSNYDNRFRGQISMRESLVDSRNVTTAKLFNEDLGGQHDEVQEFLEGLGIDVSELNSQHDTLLPSNAINGDIRPLDLTGAYTAFANNGNYNEPHAVTKVVTQNGEEIDLTPTTTRAMADSTAYMVTDILKGVIPHYGQQLSIPGYIHAAKTGTSNYTQDEKDDRGIPNNGVPDSWVVGYSPYYTMSVWVGYDEYYTYLRPDDGSTLLARSIYRETMSRLVEGFEQRDWQRPESVVSHSIENGTDPAQLAAPGSRNSVSELFVRGNEPSQRAEPEEPEEPEEIDLSAPSGLTARYIAETDDISINWDSYQLPDSADGDVQYVLNVNGNEQVLSGTEHLVTEPPRGTVEITLAVRVGDQTGPSSSAQIEVPALEEEEEEPEVDEDEELPPEEEETPPEEDNSEGTSPEENEGENETPPQDGENGGDTPPEDETPPEENENNTSNRSSGEDSNSADNNNND